MNDQAIDTLLFDTMGAVVDVDGSIRERLAAILARYDRGDIDDIADERDGHIRAAMDDVNNGRAMWQPHLSLRRTALERLIETDSLPRLTELERDELVSVINTLRAWTDSSAALTALSEKTKVVAFSNADLAHAYKPHPAIYQAALDLLHLDPARTMVVAAHPWDLRAATDAGMLTAYIARPHTEPPTPQDHFTVTAPNLIDLYKLTPGFS